MSPQTHSERAIKAAMDAMGPCQRSSAIVVLMMALARQAQLELGAEAAATLAYQVADQLAVDVKP
jgi:hypothetical protein